MDSSGINANLNNEVAALSIDKSTKRGATTKSPVIEKNYIYWWFS